MYRKNLPITTGRFPAKTNRFNCSQNNSIFSEGTQFYANKGRRFSIAAFLLLITAFLSTACETPGSVGDDIVEDEEDVASETIYLNDYNIIQENSFSGRLTYTAVGSHDDPVYGAMNSVALLKPSISISDVDTIREDDSISLRLIFNGTIYGDSLASSSYEIYEAGKIWRGASLRINDEIPVDMAGKVADFQVPASQDTVVVELDQAWIDKYAGFYNSDPDLSSAERDSVYIQNFPGLAIVPSENNQNIRFLKTQTIGDDTDTEDGEELITSFLFESNTQEDDEDDEENTGPEIISLRDWGASFTREELSDDFGNFYLHNSERVLKFQPNLPEELGSKNIVNAQLILSKNTDPQKSTPSVARPNTNFIRAHVFEEDPFDVMAEIFTTQPSFAASLNDTSDAFLMDVTQFVLNDLYGNANKQSIYITIQSVNGLIYSTHLYDPDSDDIRKPRIVITYVEE
ncbi:MAG: hypothetical protein RI575_12365 [Balneolaceae bacterium]|nr:hypothetical protein [Balneolaceae bacterium]MDR9409867.1 hypothetical protein [Balneolaceae bacterium]